jgi:hypothetical protein
MVQFGRPEGVPVLTGPGSTHGENHKAVGTPVLYCEARVVDQNLRSQSAGTLGQIVLRGKICSSSTGKIEATRAAFVDG